MRGSGSNPFDSERRIVVEDLALGHARSETVQNDADHDPCPTDDGLPVADQRFSHDQVSLFAGHLTHVEWGEDIAWAGRAGAGVIPDRCADEVWGVCVTRTGGSRHRRGVEVTIEESYRKSSTTEPDGEVPDGGTGVEIASQMLLDALFAELEVDLDMEPIDFATRVVIHFGPAASSSCPFGPLLDVRHDPDTGYLYPDLPDEAFTIWVENSEPPSGVAGAEIRVEAGELNEPPVAPDEPEPGTSGELPPGVTETTDVAVPAGAIDAGPGDVVAAHADGDTMWHRAVDAEPQPVSEAIRAAWFVPLTQGPVRLG